MTRLRMLVLATLLPLAACSGDSDELPACPKVTGSPVTAPGLTGQISFVTTGIPRPGFYHCSGIFVLNADGSGLRRLTPAPEIYASASYSPAWSPDDRHIAFISDRDGSHNLYVMAADGTNVVRLSTLEASSASWFR